MMTHNLLFAATDLYLGNTLYYLIVFALLLVLVGHYAWGPVKKMMETRQEQVTQDLTSAQADREKAAVLANQREAELKDSKQEAAKIISTAKQTAQNAGSDILAAANQAAAEIKDKAHQDAEQTKAEALADAQAQVADVSVAIAEKIIAKNLAADDQKDLVDQFIKGLKTDGTK